MEPLHFLVGNKDVVRKVEPVCSSISGHRHLDNYVVSSEQMRLMSVDAPDADHCYGNGLAHLLKPRPLVETLRQRQTADGVVAWPDATLTLERPYSIESGFVAIAVGAWSATAAYRQCRQSYCRPASRLIIPLTIQPIHFANRSSDHLFLRLLWRPFVVARRNAILDGGWRHSISSFIYDTAIHSKQQQNTNCIECMRNISKIILFHYFDVFRYQKPAPLSQLFNYRGGLLVNSAKMIITVTANPGVSNWRPAGRIRPATPSNSARNYPPENVVHWPVFLSFSVYCV